MISFCNCCSRGRAELHPDLQGVTGHFKGRMREKGGEVTGGGGLSSQESEKLQKMSKRAGHHGCD